MARHSSLGSTQLNERQRQFVEEYLIDLNVRAAALRAGYSPSVARSPDKLFRGAVEEAISAAMEARADRTRVAADKVVAELAKLAFANMLDFVTVGDDGLPRVDLKRLTRDDGAAIQALTIDYWRAPVVRKRDRAPGEGTERRRRDHVATVRRVRIQLADKRAALMDLARHLGIAAPDQAEAPEPIIRLVRVATGVPRAGDEELLERQRLEELNAMGRY